MITVALVRPDGTESADRPPWTGTYFDSDQLLICGDDVRFWPEPGEYVGYRIYHHDGRLIVGGPLFPDYRTVTVGGRRRWWQCRRRRNQGDTLTLADFYIVLRAEDDQSTRPTPEGTTSA